MIRYLLKINCVFGKTIMTKKISPNSLIVIIGLCVSNPIPWPVIAQEVSATTTAPQTMAAAGLTTTIVTGTEEKPPVSTVTVISAPERKTEAATTPATTAINSHSQDSANSNSVETTYTPLLQETATSLEAIISSTLSTVVVPLEPATDQTSTGTSAAEPTVAPVVSPPSPPSTTAPTTPLSELNFSTSELAQIEVWQKQIGLLELENKLLTLQNQKQIEAYQSELLSLQQEKDKLALDNELRLERNRKALTELIVNKEKLTLENELQQAKQAKLHAELEAIKTQLELENTINEQKQKQLLASIDSQRASLAAKNAIVEEKNKQHELELQLATARLEFESNKLEFEKSKKSLDLEDLSLRIVERDQKEEWNGQVNKSLEYLKEPYQDGHLTITDRRIELDWVIYPGVGKYVAERIHYFNNKNTEYPIFLIIDDCVGGSVMEGAQILEAMRHNQAPVYVVVKTFAASMCAVLTTLAKRSFSYPNAVILHHQIFGILFGNKKQLEEQLEEASKWTQRILYPVAVKMGITMEEFVQQMYEHNSDGDWGEFADKAVQLKWVDIVVSDIRDLSYYKNPELLLLEELTNADEDDDNRGTAKNRLNKREQIDEKGNLYVKLPTLNGKDFYHLYNPNDYYR